MTESANIIHLVEKARNGNRAAFDSIVHLTEKRLLGFIQLHMSRKLCEKVTPEDVLQEVFLRAIQSIKTFQGGDEKTFLGWLYGIALNVIRNLARSKGFNKEFKIPHEVQADNISAGKQQRRKERFERLNRAVKSLKQDYQTVILLSRIDGLKIAEIAERMGRSPGSVRNLLLRALKQLKKNFGDTESLSLPDEQLGGKGAPGVN